MRAFLAACAVALCACSQPAPLPAAKAAPAPANAFAPKSPSDAPVEPPAPGTAGGLPDDRTPLDERPALPGSAQGAAAVVERYYGLIEAGKADEAAILRGDRKVEDLTRFRELHAQIGGPGRVEGAAGSLFVEVPVVLYGRRADGSEYHASGKAVLRRANDTPDATPEQLAWRIERVELVP